MSSWKLSAFAPKPQVQGALLAHDDLEDWDFDLVISGREIAEDRPQDWVLEAWYPKKPGATQKRALASLFAGKAPDISVEKLADEDWLTLSQQGVEPIRAGRFYVHTAEFPDDPDAVNFVIPAAQAFGTGQHETTAGCLEVLSAMKSRGIVARNIADIGTGTGLLGFAAMKLWPGAKATASDIDAICAEVVDVNAGLNGVNMGSGRGEMTMVIADGMDHELLQMRGPYDLLIANILAGPLVELAPDFAAATAQGGSVLLAGLLAGEQERAVRRAYRQSGFRHVARTQRGDWAILWFRKRKVWRASLR
ncbi:ribosomal protein L11 methylase [Erythrobacter sp. NAP1]|uniref:50S ribosomal protein L11 methyltransferase n=1 Tax=Erythrobacter sp. NAP1 TaxID=237727 RepID=UPI0000686BC7|nr:50S ribosomal protein L11 methyltransferase [Erythrobacter sp. NAP1]EAQ30389.1 ribosomal protein L11 methylase [Erythrobacter sp. NAP1]